MDWNWWALAVVPVAWFVQNCIHELSHLVVGWVWEGRKPLGFWPYPHKHGGKWYFARCLSGEAAIKGRSPRPRYIAPFYAGMLWSIVWTIHLVFMCTDAWRIFVLPFAVTGFIDAAWWWRGYFWGRLTCDGQRWKWHDNVPPARRKF